MVSGPGNGFGNLPGVFLGICRVKFARGFMPLSKSLAKGNVSCSVCMSFVDRLFRIKKGKPKNKIVKSHFEL